MQKAITNISLEEKQINIFLDCILLNIGFNFANIGVFYLKKLILIAYYDNMHEIKYKELCYILSDKLNVSLKKIDSNIYNSVNTININIAKKNFKTIFHIDFDYFYISPKKLLILILNALNNAQFR